MSDAHDSPPDRPLAPAPRVGRHDLDRPRVPRPDVRDLIPVARRSAPPTDAHLREHWRILARHRWLVLSFLLVTVATTAVWIFTMRPLFAATVMLRIEKEEPRVVKFDDVKADTAEDYYPTQYQLLQSRSLANSVIASLQLDRHPEFQEGDPGWFATARHWVRRQLNRLSPSAPSLEAAAPTDTSVASPLTDAFLRQLTVEPVRGSRVVKVSFESHHPDLAAKVVNTLADAFIRQQLRQKTDATRYGAEFLAEQLDEAGQKLKGAETRLNEFLKANQIFFVATSDRAGEYHDLVTRQLTQVSESLLKARSDRITKESLYAQAVGHEADAVPAVLGNSLVGRLKEELTKLETEYRRLAQTFKPEYPRMEQLDRSITELRGQLGREVSRILGGLDAEYRAALLTERKLQGVVDNHEQLARRLGDGMPHYSVLRRDVDTNRQVYMSLLTRLKEMQVTAALPTSNISLVDRGEVPLTPSKPRKSLSLLMGAVVGLLGGVALAFLVEYLDTTVKDANDVQTNLRVPALGIVPHAIRKRERGSVGRGMTARAGDVDPGAGSGLEADPVFADAFRSLRTALLYCSPDCVPSVFMVTSPQRGEGKTTIAVGLAIMLAQRGAGDVLLVDADLRRPTLHEVFRVGTTPGFANFLAAEADVSEVVRPTDTSNLYMVPAGRSSATLADLVAPPRLGPMLENLAGRFNHVLFDTTPLLGISDALSLAPHVGGAVLVLRHGHAQREAARRAVQLLATIGTPLLGVVLNRFNPRAAGAGYYYYDVADLRHPMSPGAGVDDAFDADARRA